jgi:L-alanine-DL-glutamate epimerase-like enolase superfamily enzyme
MSGPVVTTYERVAELPLTIERHTLEERRRTISAEFGDRVTTTFHVHGRGEEGLGEDVTYDPEEHAELQGRAEPLPLEGEWTFGEFSRHVGALDLFPNTTPFLTAFLLYRRWAIESAALDLALRQAGRSLADVLEREPRPVAFVVSLRLGNPPSFEPVRRRLEAYPWLRFKLDGTPDWPGELIEQLVATGAIASIDFKGAYKGTPVDVDTDPAFYRRIAEALPDAWLEDPDLTVPEADAALEPYRDRITWDAPIHSVEDIERLAFPPRTVNVKPSRFGSVEALFAGYDHCDARGIEMYGGGQSELGVGRGQIQLLAALFHPDGVNDIAPSGYDWADFPDGLEPSPLDPRPEPTGMRRRP